MELTQYFQWQIERFPGQKEALGRALAALTNHMYGITEVRTFKRQQWMDMEIPVGLGARLSREVKDWAYSRKGNDLLNRPQSSGSRSSSTSSESTESEPVSSRKGVTLADM